MSWPTTQGRVPTNISGSGFDCLERLFKKKCRMAALITRHRPMDARRPVDVTVLTTCPDSDPDDAE